MQATGLGASRRTASTPETTPHHALDRNLTAMFLCNTVTQTNRSLSIGDTDRSDILSESKQATFTADRGIYQRVV